MKRKQYIGFILLVAIWFFNLGGTRTDVWAQDYESEENEPKQEALMGQFDFSELNRTLEELFPGEGMDFGGVVSAVVKGEMEFSWKLLGDLLKNQLFFAFQSSRKSLLQILAVALLAAVFQNFSEIFESRQVTQVGYYVVFLLLAALCLRSFQIVSDWISGGVQKLTVFMTAFCPLYYLAVAFAKGSVSAAVFYHLILLLILAVEMLVVYVAIPAVHIYMMLRVMDYLSQESYLGKFAELLETVVSWGLKALFAFVIGIHVVQGMISPAIDAVKRSTLTKGIEAVPGIGDMAGGVTEVFFATAVLIKNGIGAAGMVICLALFLTPLVQVGVISLAYRLAAAVLQPISDKRIVGCVESVGSGCVLLMRVVLTVGLLFLLTIAVVAAVTNTV